MTADNAQAAGLPADVRRILNRYTKEITTLFGSNLQSLLLYGSLVRGDYIPGRSNINVFVLLGASELNELERYAKLHRRWAKEKIVVPLIQTRQEFADSLPYFPLEYLEMEGHHLVLSGSDPFADIPLDTSHLQFQCEQELRGHLVRLRQRFIEGEGRPDAMLILLPLSLTALLPCLRGFLRLRGAPSHGSMEHVFKAMDSQLGVDPEAFRDVAKLKHGLISPGRLEVPRLFNRYMRALENMIVRTAGIHDENTR